VRTPAAAAVALVALTLPASALVGGVPVQLTVSGHLLWAVSDSGLSAFDTRTQKRVVVRSTTPYPYTTRLAASGGSVWVASIANGYTSGAVSRIEARTQRAKTMLRLAHQPVWDICAGGGLVWALYGPGSKTRLARFGPAAHPHFIVLSTRTNWCAADKFGVWITTADGRLLHVDPRADAVATVAHIPAAFTLEAGGGSVWVAAGTRVVRYDERSHRLRSFATGNTVETLSIGAARIWVLTTNRRGQSTLLRLNPITGRIQARRLAGRPTDVDERDAHVWLGGLDVSRTPTLWTIEADTLRERRLASLA
jgi:ligand-binding sensor domain-containing protein